MISSVAYQRVEPSYRRDRAHAHARMRARLDIAAPDAERLPERSHTARRVKDRARSPCAHAPRRTQRRRRDPAPCRSARSPSPRRGAHARERTSDRARSACSSWAIASGKRVPSRRSKVRGGLQVQRIRLGIRRRDRHDALRSPFSTSSSFSAIARAMRSCSANTSRTSPSYVSDQRWNPSETWISCAVMRTLSPCLRNEPSRILATPSALPIVRRSSFLPLNENDDVRPATFRSLSLASALRSSSAMPSEKYS